MSFEARILEDVEEIFERALATGNLSVALRAKELLGRSCGLFKPKLKEKEFLLENLSDEELSDLIIKIEGQLRVDHQEDGEVNTPNT